MGHLGNVTKGLTDSCDGSASEVIEEPPNHFDEQYFESIVKHEYLKAEASRRLEPTSEARPKLKGDFALAEKAEINVTVDSFTEGNDIKEPSLMSLSSKQLEISLKDKIKLEAEREILERALVAGNSELDLEPTVENVLLGTKKQRALKKPKTSLEMEIAGSPDPNVPISEHHCSGCGAQVHCQDESRPGYIPSEKFKPLTESNALEDAICQRCWYFINHKRALNVNVNVSDYSKIISAIKSKKAHILLMVDLLDFPCSVIPNLKDLLGNTTPMFIVGNKYDLLPKDAPNHHKRVEQIVLETCIQENVCDREQVSRVHLISAKTGFGVEKLITLLQGLWGSRKDIYLLGTANIGKSTLFTTLLNSDFSKTKASYMIKQPTISPWPGTTLNLLKFPILRPTQDKVMIRRARLKAEAEDALKEKRADIKLRAYWKEKVGRSFSVKLKDQSEDLPEEHLPMESEEFADPFNTMSLNTDIAEDQPRTETKPKKKQLPFRFTPMEFESGKWFFDTPGVLHDRQVLTHLTMDELKLTMANRVIIPRTLIIKPGQVIFLGGLGRLDYVQGVDSVYFTVFASEEIPVRYCSQDEAEEFYTRHAGESYFKVPIGGAERMKTFPKLLPTDYKVIGSGWQESASDVLLSSAGVLYNPSDV
ncbi:putative nitric oxide-associated protein 1-like [Apostichopus japonicus]|uniref:Putative nitric oxide-associated protein 1-like n=1 Tax=Stichopus japonicus TaxID=307972 RepID=A0A2G8KND3_STIJA|nr:putative nitric oxide-associated protein 1-like [Apostichopus japonicus]